MIKVAIFLTIIALTPLSYASGIEQNSGADISNQITPLTDMPATYVGAQQCAGCHQQQTTLWQGSHHDLAMQPANKKQC